MKDNSITYLALGGIALYLLTRPKTTTVPVSSLPIYQANQPIPAPNTGSVLLPLIATAGSIFSSIFNPPVQQQSAATNIAQGYNADGTIALPDQTQQSIDLLNQYIPTSLSGEGSFL